MLLLAVGCASPAPPVPDASADVSVDSAEVAAPDAAASPCLPWAAQTPVAPPSHAQVCVLLADAWCTLLARCDPPWVRASYGDPGVCRTRVGYDCSRALAHPDTALASAYLACVASLRASSCNDIHAAVRFATGSDRDPADTEALLGYCRVPGARPAGAACAFDTQCEGLACQRLDGATCGVCGATAARGEPCEPGTSAAARRRCAPGTYCRAGTCAAFGLVTEPCPSAAGEPSRGCGPGARCVAGTCRASLRLGASCADAADACDRIEDLACERGRCARAPALVCEGFAPDGASCGSTPLGCLAPARCGATGVCELPGAAPLACP